MNSAQVVIVWCVMMACFASASPRRTNGTKCPRGWELSNGKCYYVHDTTTPSERVSWQDARAYCQQHGGDLASVHSTAEHLFIYDMAAVKLSSFLDGPDDGGMYSVWLGGRNQLQSNCETDASGMCEYEWADGTRWAYTKWAAGEPSHVIRETPYGAQKEQCLGMIMTPRQTAKWNDYVCAPKGWNNMIGFVCQASL